MSAFQFFYTFCDNQETVQIEVCQGESDDVRKNVLIGKFNLCDLSKVPSGNPVICLFELDNNGILKVTATEKNTGKKANIVLENALTVNPKKVQQFPDSIGQWFDDETAPSEIDDNEIRNAEKWYNLLHKLRRALNEEEYQQACSIAEQACYLVSAPLLKELSAFLKEYCNSISRTFANFSERAPSFPVKVQADTNDYV